MSNVDTELDKALVADQDDTDRSEISETNDEPQSDSCSATDFRQFDEGGDAFDLKSIIEGALFASGKPLNIKHIQALFGETAPPDAEVIESLLVGIAQDYSGRGVVLNKVASGYRFQVSKSVGPWVSKLWEEKPARYSRALMETLALVAYRQPVTRGEIEDIRGVSVSTHIIKTLLEREWVRVVGHKEVPGRPAMYATTRAFLDYFNLTNLDELPTLPEIQALDPDNPIPLVAAQAESEEPAIEAELLEENPPLEAEEEEIGEEEVREEETIAQAGEDIVDEPSVSTDASIQKHVEILEGEAEVLEEGRAENLVE